MTGPGHIDIGDLVARLRGRVPGLVDALGLQGRKEGHEFVALNPNAPHPKLGPFSIRLDGAKAGIWADFSSGERGDALDLVGYALGIDKAAAVQWAKGFLGLGPESDIPRRSQRQLDAERRAREVRAREADARARGRAFKIYLDAEPSLRGTPADHYLRGRLLDLSRLGRQPRALRYHPACWNDELQARRPALVACIDSAGTGELQAVHRTWLRQDPRGAWVKDWKLRAPRKCYGPTGGGAIRLWRGERMHRDTGEIKPGLPHSQAPAGSRLVLAEGYETGLTAAIARPSLRIWAAVSVGNLALLDLPEAFAEILILEENELSAEARTALDKAVARFQGEGRRVLTARPGRGSDINDELRDLAGKGTA